MTGGPDCAATGRGHHGQRNEVPPPLAIASLGIAT